MPSDGDEDPGITPYNHQSGQEHKNNTGEYREDLAAEQISVQSYADDFTRMEHK